MSRRNPYEDDKPRMPLRHVAPGSSQPGNYQTIGPETGDEEARHILKRTRPPEPTIDISGLRDQEMQALLKQGEQDAHLASISAGFLGGNSPLSKRIWFMTAVLFAAAGLFVLAAARDAMEEDPGFFVGLVTLGLISATLCGVRFYGLVHNLPYTANYAIAMLFLFGSGGGYLFVFSVGNRYLVETVFGWESFLDYDGYLVVALLPWPGVGLSIAVAASVFVHHRDTAQSLVTVLSLYTSVYSIVIGAVCSTAGMRRRARDNDRANEARIIAGVTITFGVAAFLCACALKLVQYGTKWAANKVIEDDLRLYNGLWQQIVEQNQEPIASLQEVVRVNMSTAKCPPGTYVLLDTEALPIKALKSLLDDLDEKLEHRGLSGEPISMADKDETNFDDDTDTLIAERVKRRIRLAVLLAPEVGSFLHRLLVSALGLRDVQLRYELLEELRDKTLELRTVLTKEFEENSTRTAVSPIGESEVGMTDNPELFQALITALTSEKCRSHINAVGLVGLRALLNDERGWVDVPDTDRAYVELFWLLVRVAQDPTKAARIFDMCLEDGVTSVAHVAALDTNELLRVLRSASLLPRARALLLVWKREREPVDVSLKLTLRVAEKLAAAATRARNSYNKPKQLINSLPVLYGQAAVLNDHFQQLVIEWAGGEGVTGLVHCAPIKRRQRAIEKVFRSYRGDASYVIDLVRASVSFRTLPDLIKCLERVKYDTSVVVLQIKNRFSPSVPSNAGYRNVALSLAVVDEFTMSHAVDEHVCELQLGLAELDDKKSAGGHRRYVHWRNLQAE